MLGRIQRDWNVLEQLLCRGNYCREEPDCSMGIGSQLKSRERKRWNIPETEYSLNGKQEIHWNSSSEMLSGHWERP